MNVRRAKEIRFVLCQTQEHYWFVFFRFSFLVFECELPTFMNMKHENLGKAREYTNPLDKVLSDFFPNNVCL